MKNIKVLPESVRSSLRSGIILFDLTRVIEELVFNSLDAGATKVIVAVGVGTNYIKVTDNGCGITRDGLMLLGERYATSKFEQPADMNTIPESFGFRGEALSSLSDVSLLEVVTKAHGMPNGYRKIIKGGKCLYLGIDDDRQDVGTTVVARDLFYNQPVRRRHLQSSPKKVLHSVKECILRIALVHLKTCFKVIDIESGDELLCIYPSSSPLSLLMSGFGTDVSNSLHKLEASDGKLKLSGYVSSPYETFSVKAFQYFYISSRYISRGPIHKLLNQLATMHSCSDVLKADIRSESGKRSRCQISPTYILDLSCPRSHYDLSFEPAKTCVEFKDWDAVFTFIKKAVSCFWSQGGHMCEEDDIWNGSDTLSTRDDLVNSYGVAKKRRIHEASIVLSSPQLKMPTEEIKFSPFSKYLCNYTSKTNTLQSQDYGIGIDFSCLPDNSPKFNARSSSPEYKSYIPQESNNYLELPNKHMDHLLDSKLNRKKLKTVSFCFDDDPVKPVLRSCSSRMDLSPVIGSTRSDDLFRCETRDLTQWTHMDERIDNGEESLSDAKLNRKRLKTVSFHLDDDPVKPFLKSCSSRMDLSPVIRYTKDDNQFRCQPDDLTKWLNMDERVDNGEESDYNIQSSEPWLNDSATVWSPPRITDSSFLERESFDPLLTNRDCFTEDSTHWDSPLNHCSKSTHHRSPKFDCSFGEETHVDPLTDVDFKHHRDDDFDFSANEQVEKDIFNFDNTRYSSSQENYTFLSDHVTCKKNLRNFENDSFLYDTEWTCSETRIPVAESRHMSSSSYADVEKRKSSRCRFKDKQQPVRSSSAPPFYREKKKFVSLNSCTTVKSTKPHHETLHNASKESSGVDHLALKEGFGNFSKSNSRHDKKKNIDKAEISDCEEEAAHCLDAYNTNSDFTLKEYEGALDDFGGKWRNGCSRISNIEKADAIINQDNILDISSGMLHLSGDSLLPKSVSKKCLKDSRVLQQVDKKFIPIVGGGMLAIIDQHAADERIRLEDLRAKVLSGKMKTVSYLDAEQELVLPEIGYQLLNNYCDQIKKWGWICNFHSQSSISFKKNLNFLHNQPSVATLIAVPCILGVNLTDVDLLEFLQQLSDTDGSSAIPPAVLRVLNFKACRGAIMFGDALLPSECSLIVEELKKTSLRFQCAHGRPTTAPLVNLVELHKQIAKLGNYKRRSCGPWHGLSRNKPSLERAVQRLSSEGG